MESNNGYVKISRKLLDSNIWLDGYDAALFFYCLLNASHNRFGSLLPGQFYASITGMMKTLGWSRNCVRQHLHRLIVMNYVTKADTTHGTIYTVVDWEQISASEEGQVMTFEGQIMTHAGQIVTPRGSYCDPYQDITKKEPRTSDAREAEFEKWWAEYPRHGRKEEARNAWFRLNVPAETLMSALQNAKVSRDWLREGGRFIPTAVKWLDGYWEDFITQSESEAENSWTEY